MEREGTGKTIKEKRATFFITNKPVRLRGIKNNSNTQRVGISNGGGRCTLFVKGTDLVCHCRRSCSYLPRILGSNTKVRRKWKAWGAVSAHLWCWYCVGWEKSQKRAAVLLFILNRRSAMLISVSAFQRSLKAPTSQCEIFSSFWMDQNCPVNLLQYVQWARAFRVRMRIHWHPDLVFDWNLQLVALLFFPSVYVHLIV